MNFFSTPPLLGRSDDHSLPCASLSPNYVSIIAITTLSYPYMDEYDFPLLDFNEFFKFWDCVLLTHFIHSI